MTLEYRDLEKAGQQIGSQIAAGQFDDAHKQYDALINRIQNETKDRFEQTEQKSALVTSILRTDPADLEGSVHMSGPNAGAAGGTLDIDWATLPAREQGTEIAQLLKSGQVASAQEKYAKIGMNSDDPAATEFKSKVWQAMAKVDPDDVKANDDGTYHVYFHAETLVNESLQRLQNVSPEQQTRSLEQLNDYLQKNMKPLEYQTFIEDFNRRRPDNSFQAYEAYLALPTPLQQPLYTPTALHTAKIDVGGGDNMAPSDAAAIRQKPVTDFTAGK